MAHIAKVKEGGEMKNQKLIAAREKSGKTQAQVAHEAGISTRGYQKYELDGVIPSVRTAIRIANLLGVLDVRTLWDGTHTA